MSFAIKNYRISRIEPISGADSIETSYIGDWPIVVRKGEYSVNDLVSYFPYDSILPDSLIERMGLTGKLSGSKKNRIKPVRLRGQSSIGLICKAPIDSIEGEDLTSFYGVTKYEEVIPVQFAGQMRQHPPFWTKYDIDNIRGNKGMFSSSDLVVITEKIHGTCSDYSVEKTIDGYNFFVSSKNVTLQPSESNIYWNIARKYNFEQLLVQLAEFYNIKVGDVLSLKGEIYGVGVQDLTYGARTPQFAAFDIKHNSDYFSYPTFKYYCIYINIPTVPVLYEGSFNEEILKSCTNGKEQVSGKELHIREGCVVKTFIEQRVGVDRKVLKSVSDDYLFRKGGTEFN